MGFLKGFILVVLTVLLGFWGLAADAGELSDRIQQFPHWQSKPTVEVATGDLVYPPWMEGEWLVTSTLVDLVAPLSPKIVTPGFEKNRQDLNQPIQFKVRFVPEKLSNLTTVPYPFLQPLSQQNLTEKKSFQAIPFEANHQENLLTFKLHPSRTEPIQNSKSKIQNPMTSSLPIVGDRAYNGTNIAKAILGDEAVLSVKVDPQNPNRQITQLKGDRQLVSIVTGRGSETPNPNQFDATEISQQIFRGENLIYLNEVETTTSYQVQWDEITPSKVTSILADQITAIYLSPQDPDYFAAARHPVALYRYQLQLLPL